LAPERFWAGKEAVFQVVKVQIFLKQLPMESTLYFVRISKQMVSLTLRFYGFYFASGVGCSHGHI
jgi:hypothetical protein